MKLPLLSAALVASALSAAAQTFLFQPEVLTASHPTFNRPSVDGSELSDVGTAVHYISYAVHVETSAPAFFASDSFDVDTFIALYRSPFDPNNALTNLLAVNDDGYDDSSDSLLFGDIVPGDYTLVVTTYDNNEVGNILVEADWTPVPEPTEWAMLAGAGLVGFGLWRRRQA